MTDLEMLEIEDKELRIITMIIAYMIGALIVAIFSLYYGSLLHFASILLGSVIVLYFFLLYLAPSIYKKMKEAKKQAES